MTRNRIRIVAASILAGLMLGACGEDRTTSSGAYALQQLASRVEMQQVIRPYDGIADLLANVSYRAPDGTQRPSVAAAVVGQVIRTEDGRAFVDTESGSQEVPFRSDRATWRTVHLLVKVQEQLEGAAVPEQIRVGLAIGSSTDIARFRRSLDRLGTVLLLLQTAGPVFDYDPRLFSITESGALLITADPSGKLDLPLVPADERGGLLGSVHTLRDARVASQSPRRTVEVDAVGDRVDRG